MPTPYRCTKTCFVRGLYYKRGDIYLFDGPEKLPQPAFFEEAGSVNSTYETSTEAVIRAKLTRKLVLAGASVPNGATIPELEHMLRAKEARKVQRASARLAEQPAAGVAEQPPLVSIAGDEDRSDTMDFLSSTEEEVRPVLPPPPDKARPWEKKRKGK